ncbi:MAG: hypothetical protein HKM01_07865 [Gallionella sp.]|nr:hypothetical protein [Gallionella sp.]
MPNDHQIRKPRVLVCMILGEMDDAPALVDAHVNIDTALDADKVYDTQGL